MTQGITIATWPGGQESCEVLLDSIWGVTYPVLIVVNDSNNVSKEWQKKLYWLSGEMRWHVQEQDYDGYELGAIETTLRTTDWDEFIFLQDTIEVKNIKIFDLLFENYKGKSVSYNPHFQMYLAKYRRVALEKLVLPQVRTKVEAVRQEELFAKQYTDIEETDVFNPSFRDENFYESWEERFGRRNLKMEDEFIIKYKGTWNASQLV